MPEIKCSLKFRCSDFPKYCDRCENNYALKRSLFIPIKSAPPDLTQPLSYEKELPPDLENLKELKFKNEGELYSAAWKYFKLTSSRVDPIIKRYDIRVPAQRELAWVDIIQRASRPIKGG